ncbi:hypothetical protein PILCRDRAFT_829114 [Piloderma croceum F 1598]|uniref:Uncharacterized protein n=1 Tax=Piloderma croceum (strain F 1598) TaxID=765440 RepID=A0A0C3B8A0_PILCF|nr:hypothetical protein PILCRDRAFT_829114 [Piloderma croceum F 1598]
MKQHKPWSDSKCNLQNRDKTKGLSPRKSHAIFRIIIQLFQLLPFLHFGWSLRSERVREG